MEKAFDRAAKDHPDHRARLLTLKELYCGFARGEFTAAEYFAPHVERYYTVQDLKPCQLDSFYALNVQDFVTPRSVIDPTTFSFTRDSEGNRIITFWQKFSCFRNDKSKFESCRVFTKIVFNNVDQIVYFNDEKIQELVYTEERLTN